MWAGGLQGVVLLFRFPVLQESEGTWAIASLGNCAYRRRGLARLSIPVAFSTFFGPLLYIVFFFFFVHFGGFGPST